MDLRNNLITIGIDPSFTNLGMVTRSTSKSQLPEYHYTWTFQKWLDWINQEGERIAGAIIENPALDKHNWTAWQEFVKAGATKSAFSKALKIAGDVGENKAAAKQIIIKLQELEIPFYQVAPSQRDQADPDQNKPQIQMLKWPTKTNLKQYRYLITSAIEGRTSEHSRDAGTLLVGRSLMWIQKNHRLQQMLLEKQPKLKIPVQNKK